jgi:geranyl-CoA carboxylase alpha subunit
MASLSFIKVLVANRGEIAVRVIRAARALGCRTVAVYSEADTGAPHASLADEAVCIGPAPAAESYLSIPCILAAARATGAEAVHPGYGFLSENAEFAAACAAAGLVFIGPPVEAIRLMGNKRQAKLRMEQAGVPCVPGYSGGDQGDQALLDAAGRIGVPLMVKAAAGGGGRGMRLVHDLAELPQALALARAEAQNAFGSDELILERALVNARHVEIQVFADSHGHTLHLGERDCSVQRRHQKVIEESPSPAMTPTLRERMGAAAVAAARAVEYVGAGTVEFLLDADGAFYFLEMNTRLQVEHPVTEMVTGIDLVQWQLLVAAGEPLPLAQEQVRWHGHAIEARLYAEDATGGYLPQTGRITLWHPAQGPGLRVDAGIAAGQEVTPHYDAMLAKVIAHGATREEARRRLMAGLRDTLLLGLTTNRDFLLRIVVHPEFAAGRATTAFLGAGLPGAAEQQEDPLPWALAAVLLHGLPNPALARWLIHPTWAELFVEWAGVVRRLAVSHHPGGAWRVIGDGLDVTFETWSQEALSEGAVQVRYMRGGVQATAHAALGPREVHLDWGGGAARFAEPLPEARGLDATGPQRLLAPMSGKVVAVRARVGAQVSRGQCVLVLESMKIQHEIAATGAGRVIALPVAVGDQVAPRQLLAELEPSG